MSDAMLGVGSLPPARYSWDPDMARLEVLLPVSARLLPPPPPFPPTPCTKSMLAADFKGCSACFCRFSVSWADTVAERGISKVEEGGLGGSEETEGCGIGLEELALRTCTEDEAGSEGEEGLLSRHNT